MTYLASLQALSPDHLWEFDGDFDDNVVVAIGLNTAQYVSATATISKATGQNISLVAPLERNYNNS